MSPRYASTYDARGRAVPCAPTKPIDRCKPLEARRWTRLALERLRPQHSGTSAVRRNATQQTNGGAAQQHADALLDLLRNGSGRTIAEIVLHIRGDGCTLDDGTPLPGTVVERIAPEAFLRALIHDAGSRPVDASNKRRHPTTRQQRSCRNGTGPASTAASTPSSTTTMCPPTNRPTTPSRPSSNSGAPPVTAAGTPPTAWDGR